MLRTIYDVGLQYTNARQLLLPRPDEEGLESLADLFIPSSLSSARIPRSSSLNTLNQHQAIRLGTFEPH